MEGGAATFAYLNPLAAGRSAASPSSASSASCLELPGVCDASEYQVCVCACLCEYACARGWVEGWVGTYVCVHVCVCVCVCVCVRART